MQDDKIQQQQKQQSDQTLAVPNRRQVEDVLFGNSAPDSSRPHSKFPERKASDSPALRAEKTERDPA